MTHMIGMTGVPQAHGLLVHKIGWPSVASWS